MPRFLGLLALGVAMEGCGVPDVYFVTDGGAADDAPAKSEAAADARPSADGTIESATDSGNEAAGDAGPAYCVGPDGGTPPPNGLACCPGGIGEVCAGGCGPKACADCGNCVWPSVCCTTGANGTCKPFC